MPTFRTPVGPNRTLTLPKELCKRLKIVQGTPVEFFLTLDGQVHFHAITGTTQGFGKTGFEQRMPPVSIREMDDAIGDHLAKKHDRILTQTRKRKPAAQRPRSAAE